MHQDIVMFFNLLAGRKFTDVSGKAYIPHTKLRLSETETGATGVAVKCCGEEESVSMTAVLGVYLTQLVSEIQNGKSDKVSG